MKHGILFFFFLSVLSFGNTGLAKELVIGLDADMSSVAKAGGMAIQRGAQLEDRATESSRGEAGVRGFLNKCGEPW